MIIECYTSTDKLIDWNTIPLTDLLSDYTPNGWEDLFDTVKDTIPEISQKLEEYTKEHTIFPPMDLTFNIFDQIKPKDVKVVILGQDPYIKSGEAMGLSFSVPPGIRLPPSLRNIYKELVAEGYQSYINRKTGDLTEWVKKGVFLYNCCLTVNEGKSGSHKDLWKEFTERVISYLNSLDNIAWIFLGKKAQQYSHSIDTTRHGVFVAGHPSPLNRLGDFAGSNVFNDAENYLYDHGREFSWELE